MDSITSAGIRFWTCPLLCGSYQLTASCPEEPAHVVLVDRRPVVLQDAAGISRVCIPGPVDVADAVHVQKGHQGALPHPLGVLARRAPAELAKEHGGSSFLLQIGPMFLPDSRQGLSEISGVRDLEPRLVVDLRPVVMGRIHQLVRPRELHGKLPGSFQVPPPPVGIAMVLLDASTRMSQSGLTARMALPACWAARRQSVLGLPSPQVAGPCGSLARSAPMTVSLPR